MTIADFHNDILTSASFDGSQLDFGGNRVVTAVFRGSKSFAEAFSLTQYSSLLAFEDVGYQDLDFEKLVSVNPLYVGLTWNGENRFGYGCDYSFALKRSGVELIKNLNKFRIAVDTAHLSKRGFIDVIDNAEIVVNSHTLFNGIFKHKRNLDDWQIKLLVERGALIGITCCGHFMTNRKTCKIADFIDNILYYYEKYGSDGLCIGTDFNGTDFLPEGLENYEGFNRVEDELKSRGVLQKDVDKIFFKNLSEFCQNRVLAKI